MTRDLTSKKARQRARALKEALYKYGYEYYVLDSPTIDDAVYDSLKNELLGLENRFDELVDEDSPTRKVLGEPLPYFEKVSHSKPMLSIDDLFEEADVYLWEDFLKRNTDKEDIFYFCEGKIDGLAVALRYEGGRLNKAVTRGDGVLGEDVTFNVKTIDSVPVKTRIYDKSVKKYLSGVDEKSPFEVRGEVYITYSDFEKFNQAQKKGGEQVFANPRNLAAGSIRQLDPCVARSRPLSFRAYDIFFGQNIFETYGEKHKVLRAFGFPTDNSARAVKGAGDVVKYWREAENKRDASGVPVDGVVVRLSNIESFERLGTTGKSPRGIRALKFASQSATTRLLGIDLQIGRTGTVTPVANLAPVALGGVTVKRATLHNLEEIERLGVKIGDTVVVQRAGDVIPKVSGVIKKARSGTEKKFKFPLKCPSCGGALESEGGEVAIRCVNKSCPAVQRQELIYFVSRKNFNIYGLGKKVLDRLIEEGLVLSVVDIFRLKKQDLAGMERFAQKSADNLINSIERSKTITLEKFISALNIRRVGEDIAIDLARAFGKIENIQNASLDELIAIDGVGDMVAESVKDWFEKTENIAIINDLKKQGVKIINPKMEQDKKNDIFSGATFVFTGRMEDMERSDAQNEVRKMGGSVAASVSLKTDYVVAGGKAGAKLEKARVLGVNIISEKEFIKMIK